MQEDTSQNQKVRFKMDSNEDEVYVVRTSTSMLPEDMNDSSRYRNYQQQQQHPQRRISPASYQETSPVFSQQPSPVCNRSYRGTTPNTETIKYLNIINNVKEEVNFLEESNSNLLVELRESQDSNYVLTDELKRAQRSNINYLNELQACQTANAVLRHELQRIELDSIKTSSDREKYLKANKLLREEIKDLKTSHLKRRDSIRALRDKAHDIQSRISSSKETNTDINSLKEAIDNFAFSVESESLNGYLPTDSDTQSINSLNSVDADERSLKTTVLQQERNFPNKEYNRSYSTLNDSSSYHEELTGLFGRKQEENIINVNRDDTSQGSPARVIGRRGSLENILAEKNKHDRISTKDINQNHHKEQYLKGESNDIHLVSTGSNDNTFSSHTWQL